ncbi:hypothetical protein N3K66_009076 [Trichothecium roseum]|uniref:Uncharacterized protein n=1 Tax=Trichothecium roseum TaxID=47278 RepID=A0ACC0UR59_9HYPO|nr:hypothetical protein N3K66_009076 [Trichothecium roseum]
MASRHRTRLARVRPYPTQVSKPPIRVDEPLFDPTSDFMSWSTVNEANEPNEFNEPQGQGNMQSKLDSLSKEIERLQKQMRTDDRGAPEVHVRRTSGDAMKHRADNSSNSQQDQPRSPALAHDAASQRVLQNLFSSTQALQEQIKGLQQQLATSQHVLSQQISELQSGITSISADLGQQKPRGYSRGW